MIDPLVNLWLRTSCPTGSSIQYRIPPIPPLLPHLPVLSFDSPKATLHCLVLYLIYPCPAQIPSTNSGLDSIPHPHLPHPHSGTCMRISGIRCKTVLCNPGLHIPLLHMCFFLLAFSLPSFFPFDVHCSGMSMLPFYALSTT